MLKTIKQINPYLELMRLHQPVGIFLLLWPCLVSLSLATNGHIYRYPMLTIIFIIGSVIMRSAGCIFNDLIDRKFDKKVLRTKNRPITNGTISSKNAIKLLVVLLVIASSLLFFLNSLAIIIAFLAVPLIALYPFCKRFTYWPQLCLGITFNLGVLMAWASVESEISLSAILLYIGFIFWTLGYDSIYAHQDKEDDLKLGLKSTAIKLGEKTAKYLNFFYTIFVTLIIFAFGILAVKTYFYVFMTLPVVLLFWQVNTIDIHDRKNCAIRFKINVIVGALMFLASMTIGVNWW